MASLAALISVGCKGGWLNSSMSVVTAESSLHPCHHQEGLDWWVGLGVLAGREGKGHKATCEAVQTQKTDDIDLVNGHTVNSLFPSSTPLSINFRRKLRQPGRTAWRPGQCYVPVPLAGCLRFHCALPSWITKRVILVHLDMQLGKDSQSWTH